MVDLTVDTAGFDAMLFRLARAVKKPMSEVILAESQSILENARKNTKVLASKVVKDRANRKFNTYSAGHYGQKVVGNEMPRISISPKVGRVWWVDTGKTGKRTYYLMGGVGELRKWSDARWHRYVSDEADRKMDLADYTKERIARRGLPQQSWVLLADLIHRRIQAPNFVRDARVRGKKIDTARADVRQSEVDFVIHFLNFSSATTYAGGTRAIQAAMNGRVKFFQKNLALGVFDSVKDVSRAYPNLLTVK